MTVEQGVRDEGRASWAADVSLHISLIILLSVACLAILSPFLPLIGWGIIIAIAVHPGYRKIKDVLGGRSGLAATVFTLILLALVSIPIVLLGETLIEGTQSLAGHFKNGTLALPQPPANIGSWPVIGAPLKEVWSLASNDLNTLLRRFAPQIKAIVTGLVSGSAGIGLAVMQFFVSIIIAGILLAYARSGAELTRSIALRLFGEKGPEFEELAASTIRSVTTGILGVALIQSIFAGVGFLVMGLPGAGLWAVVFLFAAVLQVGILVLIPAVIYAFVTVSSTKAVIFAIWCVFVGLMDNFLKPLLLGRGVSVPILVIFLGVIGGFMAMGIIGLFVGAVVVSVGYKLFLAWLAGPEIAGQG